MADAPVFFATAEQFQAQLDRLSDHDELELHAFEYPGPIEIKRQVTIDGRGATLWALEGPVCTISSPGVTLRNLRIEVTGDDVENAQTSQGCALQVLGNHNLLLDNVEVRGSVQGLPAEEGQWRYPFSIDLGDVDYGREHRFLLRLYVPVPCRIQPEVYGVSVEPHTLVPGRHEVTLTIDPQARDALLLGTLCLKTAFLKRQIRVAGRVVQSASGQKGARTGAEVLYEPSDWDRLGPVQAPRERTIEVNPPAPPQPPPPPATPPPGLEGARGPQRVAPPTPPSPPVGRPSRILQKPVVLSSIFNQAPPPIETDAGQVEPGVKLSSVFGPPPSAPETQTTAPAPEPPSGPSEDASTSIGSEDEGKSVSEEQPVVEPQGKGRPKKTPLSGSQSIRIGSVFLENAQPARQDEKDTNDSGEPAADSPEEKVKPRAKPKPPKRGGTIPDIFRQ